MNTNRLKTILSITLAGIMLFGSVPAAIVSSVKFPELDFTSVTAYAQNEGIDSVLGLKYVVDGGVIITGYTDNLAVDAQGNFTVPEKIANGAYSVTAIGENAFRGCDKIKTLTIPSCIKQIGICAFQDCPKLTTLYFNSNSCAMPDTSYEDDLYGESAFRNCGKLTKAVFGSSVTAIPAFIFHNVSSLEEINFEAKVTSIGDMAFRGCTGVFDIYYAGTKTDWNIMTVGINNDIIRKAVDHEQFNGSHDHARVHFTAPTAAVYTLTYNANGGAGAPAGLTGNGSINLSAFVPSRNGYTFKGWATSPSATSAQYQPGTSYNLTGNTVLYAVWEVKSAENYTLVYNANGGIGAPADQTGSGKIIISGFKPSRNGYVFKGWSADPYDFTARYQPGDYYTLNGNTIFYAIWGISKPVFHMRSSASVDYRTHVILNATAENVQPGCVLAIFEGSTLLATGNRNSVSCDLGEVTANRTLKLKVIDASGCVQTDENGIEYSATCEIRVNSGFFTRVFAFFRGISGAIPTQTI